MNTQPAPVMSDPASGGYRFSKKIDIAEGSNTITVQAVDKDNPPNTTTKNYTLNVSGLSRSFTYDANGNLLTDSSNGTVQRSFTWDAKNRLKTVTKNGTTYRWDYDYHDRRVKEYSYPAGGAVPTFPGKLYIWDGTDLIQERSCTTSAIYTSGGTTTRTHLFGGFMEGGTNSTTVAKYQTFTDHLGHVRDVIAANTVAGTLGAVAARYDYTTFQGPVKTSGTVDASLLTIGRYYHHAASGLELALYRAYDPELGRWISEDPIAERGGRNLYGFVANRPNSEKDLLGLIISVVGGGPQFDYAEGVPKELGQGTLWVGVAAKCSTITIDGGGTAPVYKNGIQLPDWKGAQATTDVVNGNKQEQENNFNNFEFTVEAEHENNQKEVVRLWIYVPRKVFRSDKPIEVRSDLHLRANPEPRPPFKYLN